MTSRKRPRRQLEPHPTELDPPQLDSSGARLDDEAISRINTRSKQRSHQWFSPGPMTLEEVLSLNAGKAQATVDYIKTHRLAGCEDALRRRLRGTTVVTAW